MSSPGNIVVVIDNDEQTNLVIERGALLAEALQSPLVLLCCVYDPYIAGKRFADSEGLRSLRGELMDHELSGLEALAASIDRPGLTVSSRVVWDTPRHEAVTRQAEYLNARMLVAGTHRHGLLDRTIFSNSDWQLLRTAACPLYLVRKTTLSENPLIYAAVDPMHAYAKPADLDDRVICSGQELESALNGELHLIHAVESIDALAAVAAAGMVPIAAGRDALQVSEAGAHEKRLKLLAEEFGLDVTRIHQETGFPASVLLSVANKSDVDLMILGAVSRSLVRQAIIGSTAERVLERLPSDMLVIKPAWFEADACRDNDLEFRDSAQSGQSPEERTKCAQY